MSSSPAPSSSRALGATDGYYRFATLHHERVVFVSEDDLWEVPLEGGIPRRMTTAQGEVTCPVLSPDGSRLAYVAEEEGVTEVYVMAGRGGPARRLTYDGHLVEVVGWTADASAIVYSSNVQQPFSRRRELYSIDPDGGEPVSLGLGPARTISWSTDGRAVLCRHQDDIAMWKRYRGGTAGALWIDRDGDGDFERLLADHDGNTVRPLWLGERVFFLTDVDGVGNIYSCTPAGADVRRHTDHEFYVRHPTSDGRRIVYTCGADIWWLDTSDLDAGPQRVAVEFRSPRPQRVRRFVDAEDYFEDATLHPKGHALLVNARGNVYAMGLFEGAVRGPDADSRVRHRLPRYLHDGQRVLLVSDEGGEEALEIHTLDATAAPERLDGLRIDGEDIGRALDIAVSPVDDRVLVSNHRHELLLIDLESRAVERIARSEYARIDGMAWSPDGRWIAYSLATSHHTAAIRLRSLGRGDDRAVTQAEFRDVRPSFDDKGRFLYFLSYRDFDPVYDSHTFNLGFPRGMRLCLATLRDDIRSPFVAMPRPLSDDGNGDDGDDDSNGSARRRATHSSTAGDTDGDPAHGDVSEKEDPSSAPAEGDGVESDDGSGNGSDEVRVDLDGIERRVVLFPVSAGTFSRVEGAGQRVFFTDFPVRGSLDDDDDDPVGRLRVLDLVEHEVSTVMGDVVDFEIGADRKTLLVAADDGLRVLQTSHTAEKDDSDDEPGRKSGWIDLDRVQVEVAPALEWRQMLREAWRLMRDHFWSEDMSGVDWEAVYTQYAPLVDRVGSRSEFSDLVWEMQGELGTSHAYEYGGDYRQPPGYDPGFLAADVRWDAERAGYAISHIVTGDTWDRSATSPLARPGVNISEGDVILAIDGKRVDAHRSVQSLLVNKAGDEVELTLLPAASPAPDDDGQHADDDADKASASARTVTVRTLHSEFPARYRAWVVANRDRIHDASDGRVGYVHVPNMVASGFAEFYRSYMSEVSRPGLIVDVRYNSGGHVSQLLLEKLSRRRLGYDVQRWGKPIAYPEESVAGPMVALTNENAGSDGDIFSHCFKLMELGPLVGKRTWGGVVGIWPRHGLVDGSTTSQPEFAFWFKDVGWGVENYGTDPDVEIDIAPQDYAAGRDPQLDKALEIILEAIEREQPGLPDFGQRPSRARRRDER